MDGKRNSHSMLKKREASIIASVDYLAMGKRIRRLRHQYKLTQEGLAELCDISASFVGHIEMGTRIPSLDTIAILADVLQTSIDYLAYGSSYQGDSLSVFEKTPILPDEIASEMSRLLFRHHATIDKSSNMK